MALPERQPAPDLVVVDGGSDDELHASTQTFGSETEHSSRRDAAAPGPPVQPPYFRDALDDAERLLQYAAQIGLDVHSSIRHAVLHARAIPADEWTEDAAARLLVALTHLAALMKPVTAESLKACTAEGHTVLNYWKWAMGLAIIIVPFSIASFITSGFSDAIRKDVATANELAVKLSSQLHPAPAQIGGAGVPSTGADTHAAALPAGLSVVGVVTELQQFASVIRSIDGRARRLNDFVFRLERDPYETIRNDQAAIHTTFQLPAELPTHLAEATDGRIKVYQDVRYFAQSLLDDVSTFYGAITTCVLPVLYALLGTCVYLLRSFETQTRARTFTTSPANSARFLIAGIGGAVVGLFNNFTVTQGASIPPLAIAFLVGYAVDVFFSFLENLLQAFMKTRNIDSSLTAAVPSGDKA